MTVAIALNRFALGARPDEALPSDPKRWLAGQLDRYEPRPAPWAAQPDLATLAADYIRQQEELQAARQANIDAGMTPEQAKKSQPVKDARKDMRQDSRQAYQDAVNARMESALVTPTPFVERLVHFWSNHFAVSTDKKTVVPLAGNFEAEAIRPHVLGKFEDMLVAVEQHAAMQFFLDQAQSIGPNSLFISRLGPRNPRRRSGLNENLAREIMELHTLGVRTGYTQADVTEFAKALTGWRVGPLKSGGGQGDEPAIYGFRPALHEPGDRTIMGKRYAEQGEAQARAVLHDLAIAPATSRHLATKLARHFVADNPPPALVAKLSDAFLRSGGHLPAVYRALIDAPESWAPQPAKFKTPWEWLVSSMRAIGTRELGETKVANLMQQLGQPVWRPGSPAGYDDIAASWAAPDALVRRVEVAQRLAMRVGDRLDPRTLGEKLMPGVIGAATAQAITNAESPPTGLSLLLVSPEFQRR